MTETALPAPKQVPLTFPLQDGEQVLELCRRHWIYLWPNVIGLLLAAFVPPSMLAVALSQAGAYEGLAAQAFWVAAAVWMLYWVVRAFLAWYRYHNDA